MIDPVLASLIGVVLAAILTAVVGPLIVERVKRRWTTSPTPPSPPPSAPLPAPADLPPSPVPPVPRFVLLPRPNHPTLMTTNHDEAGEYPVFLSVSELPVSPRVLLPYETPMEVAWEIKNAPPLSRETFARNTYVGRWVRWTGIVRNVAESEWGHCTVTACSSTSLSTLAEDMGLVSLMFPKRRRGEIEHLREGDLIVYEAQIPNTWTTPFLLVRVEIIESRRGVR